MNRYLRFFKNWRKNLSLFYWICGHTKPFLPSLIALLLIQSSASLIAVTLTRLHKQVIDAATAGGGDIRGSVLLYGVGAMVSLLIGILGGVFSAVVNERFAFSIRQRIFSALLRTYMPAVNRYHSGDMVTRLSSDVDTISSGVSEIVPALLSMIVMFAASFYMLAHYDWGLAMFALAIGPVVAVISVVTGRSIRQIQRKVQESESAYRSNLQETVENLLVVKSFEGQQNAEERFSKLRADKLYWVRRRQKVGAISRFALSGSFQLGFVIVLGYSASQLAAGAITYGTMTMFFTLVTQIQSPIMGLAQSVPKVVSIFTSAERTHELEKMPLEDDEIPQLADGAVGVEIANLHFSYGKEQILQAASATLHAGQFVALMGSSGVGKTTLIRLIMAFYLPQDGRVELLDSAGKRALVTAGARRYMSYVPQGNTLMSGTISSNLRAGRAEATEDEMWRMLEIVYADGFVRELPQGLHAPVGERGLGFSEGQSQRIAIARALIRRAPLLILDEATSALDEETELTVLRHLRASNPRPTCILITHRRSVLQFCDRGLRIRDKGIEEISLDQMEKNEMI